MAVSSDYTASLTAVISAIYQNAETLTRIVDRERLNCPHKPAFYDRS